jgi:ATP-dependent exoDNAse (exonuclease V) alpha subunit
MPGVKGKSGGKRANAGRKSRAEEMGLAALLDKCWTADDREKCIEKLAALANAGDIDAVKLLMAYTFGKPKEQVEVSGSESAPFKLIVQYVNDWRAPS